MLALTSGGPLPLTAYARRTPVERGAEPDPLRRQRGSARALDAVVARRAAAGQVAQGDRLGARPDTELVGEHRTQHLEAPQHAGPVAVREQVPHQPDVGDLVGRVEIDQAGMIAERPQHVPVAQLESLAVVEHPVFVGVIWQQITGVRVRCSPQCLAVAGGQGLARQPLELRGVDRHIGVGEQRHRGPVEDDAVDATARPPYEVGCFVQAVRTACRVRLGPKHIEENLAVHPSPRRQGEELGQSGSVAPAELGHPPLVDDEAEATEDLHGDGRHDSVSASSCPAAAPMGMDSAISPFADH